MRDYPHTRPRLTYEYLRGLVVWLAESDYRLISYNDLAGRPAFGEEDEEFGRWCAGASQRGEKAILLQYDVDARPDVTARLLDAHIELGQPGNAMIFFRKIFDWKLKREGVVEYDDSYALDFRKYEALQAAGGVVGYHCNAFDRAAGNEDYALELFHQDVAELRKHLDIRFFSMHGGHVAEGGRCNATLQVAPYLDALGLTWVHNGHSVTFHRNWADGSASNPNYLREPSDLLDFILSTRTGQRTRLLFHPQYYNDMSNRHFEFPVLEEQRWVRDTRALVDSGKFDGPAYWSEREEQARQSIEQFGDLFEAPADEGPVFVNGLSRSGTTLLVSMFDSHPDGAMAYESYPNYLYVPSDDGVLSREEFIYTYQCLINNPESVAFRLLDRPPLRNLRRFVAVTSWTGMSTEETGEMLRAYLVDHERIDGPQAALAVVAASARFKLQREGGVFWGTKCQGNFGDYLAMWPEARFVYIMRDGLDILASQLNTGAFNPDPEKLGAQWRQHYLNFERFVGEREGRRCGVVRYENLVRNPEGTMRQVCEEIDLDYHPRMIRQHELVSTLVRNPRGQLSAERVQMPIDETAIGRWRSDLTDSDARAFLRGCGGEGVLEAAGYAWRR